MLDNVYINGRFSHRPISGVERYASELAKRLIPPSRVINPGRGLPGLVGHTWEQVALPRRLPKGSLLWSPANTGPLSVREQAITIHDLAPLDHPEWYRPAFRLWYRLVLPRLVRNSRLLFTVSRFSRRRISERFGVPAKRIVLVPAGVDREVFYPTSQEEVEGVKRKYKLSGDYLLAVGTLQPRKNLTGLLRAWDAVQRVYPGLSLVIAGGTNRSVFQDDWTLPLGKRMVWTGYIPDGELAGLYTGAHALVFPSFYEGFGLPLLEAMACGTPVLASAAGALPETAGRAALYFNPNSWKAMARCILSVLKDPDLRHDLRREGYERACAYSWENSAAALVQHLVSVG